MTEIRRAGSTSLHYIEGNSVFYSYETPVAAQLSNGRYFRTEKNHSVTTTSHIKKWLAGNKAETKPQEWFDALAKGILLVDEPSGTPPEVWVGGVVFLIQQPGGEHGITRMVEDEYGFAEALAREVPGFKEIETRPIYFNGQYSGEAPGITLVNGIIPVTLEVPADCDDLDAWAYKRTVDIRNIWDRFAI
jgi:hypothetical protein